MKFLMSLKSLSSFRSLPSLLTCAALLPTLPLAAAPAAPEKLSDGLLLPAGDAWLKLEVCADDVIRVACARDRAFFSRKTLAAEPTRKAKASWTFATTTADATITTAKLKVRVDLATGAVTFLDAAGNVILAEAPGSRKMTAAIVQGERTFHVRQEWEPNEGEALYGLGQHQLGILNLKGYDLDLWQHNGTVAIPFLVSSRGYGILWDNTSFTRFGDLRPLELIPSSVLYDAGPVPARRS